MEWLFLHSQPGTLVPTNKPNCLSAASVQKVGSEGIPKLPNLTLTLRGFALGIITIGEREEEEEKALDQQFKTQKPKHILLLFKLSIK